MNTLEMQSHWQDRFAESPLCTPEIRRELAYRKELYERTLRGNKK